MLIVFQLAQAQAQELHWANRAGGNRFDYARAISIDSSGNSYITGIFEETASFDGVDLTSVGGPPDIFLAKYNPDGTLAWARQTGGPLALIAGIINHALTSLATTVIP